MMKRLILGLVLSAAGVLLALGSADWIEQRYGVEPDAGSGALEYIISAVLVSAGMALAGLAWLARSRMPGRRRSQVASDVALGARPQANREGW
jgi:hypothetical protein